MRIAYKIGFGMIILFLIWFIYALFTYEDMLILIPLSVGVALIPIFAWYFLLVFLETAKTTDTNFRCIYPLD